MPTKRIGEILIEVGAIDQSRLAGALRAQQTFGGKVGDTMVDYGFIDDATLARAVARQFGIPMVTNLIGMQCQREAGLVTAHVASEACVLPIAIKGKTLFVAMRDPGDAQTRAKLARITGHRIYPLAASRSELGAAIQYYYEGVQAAVFSEPDAQTHSSRIVRQDDPDRFVPIVYSRG